ncbi:hypothetical protein BJ996_003814 [Streptomyces phaeogriseichromatogenes]|nr:hypothetical protein [Streptomyces murinus]
MARPARPGSGGNQPAGTSRPRLKSGKVDAHGNLVASYKITRNTTFEAAFASVRPGSPSWRTACAAGGHASRAPAPSAGVVRSHG